MKSLQIIGVAALAFSLSACASIVTSGAQDVQVTSSPGDGAACTLTNAEGNWSVTTPGSAKVKRSKTALEVQCTKAGMQAANTSAASDFEPWTLGNLILGGVPGLLIDWGTGAIHKYPNAIQVPMNPSPGASNEPKGPPTS